MITLSERPMNTASPITGSSHRQAKKPKEKTRQESTLFGGRRVLGDGLCALRDSVLGKFTGQDKSDTVFGLVNVSVWNQELNARSLDLARRDGGLLVVGSELGCLSGDALKDIVDEGVQDGHGAVGDTGVRVDLLEDCKDASVNETG
jgi:hypothetical protein